MAGKKILMLVGDFSEEYEIFVFEQAMIAVGHTVDVVCPDKKAGEILKTSLHDFEGDKTYTEKPGHNYILSKSFSAVKPADYDAVYVAGGRGPEYIRIDKRVQAIVRHFHEADKPIFTICHGVQVLMAASAARLMRASSMRLVRSVISESETTTATSVPTRMRPAGSAMRIPKLRVVAGIGRMVEPCGGNFNDR